MGLGVGVWGSVGPQIAISRPTMLFVGVDAPRWLTGRPCSLLRVGLDAGRSTARDLTPGAMVGLVTTEASFDARFSRPWTSSS